ADRIGSLVRMSALPALSAARTGAGLDVETSDERLDAGQIGLVLHDLILIVQRHPAHGAFAQGNVDDAIHLIRLGQRPQVGLVSLASARPFVAAFGWGGGPRGFAAVA